LEALKEVGTRIRLWRKAIPLKALELAKILTISQGSLSDIENNKSLPSAQTIAAFMSETDINIFYMLTGETEKETPQELQRPYKISFDNTTLAITHNNKIKKILISRE